MLYNSMKELHEVQGYLVGLVQANALLHAQHLRYEQVKLLTAEQFLGITQMLVSEKTTFDALMDCLVSGKLNAGIIDEYIQERKHNEIKE